MIFQAKKHGEQEKACIKKGIRRHTNFVNITQALPCPDPDVLALIIWGCARAFLGRDITAAVHGG